MRYLWLPLPKKASIFPEDGQRVNLLLTIKSLYLVNGFVAVSLYLPQIYKVCQDKRHALSLSLPTFGGWSIGSLVSSLYAWFYLRDVVFTAISLGNMAGSGSIFLIAASSRWHLRKGLPRLPAGNEADRVAGLA